MNYFNNVSSGFEMGNQLMDSRLRDELIRQQMGLAEADEQRRATDMQWRQQEHDRLRQARSAAGKIGATNSLLGYEGVEGATRPAWLQELYATNPELAMQLEEKVAAPFAMQRDVEKAGKLEHAKRSADYELGRNMLAEYFNHRGGGSEVPRGTLAGDVSGDPVNYPVGGPLPRPSLMGLSGDESTFEMTPQGPKIAFKQKSPFDKAVAELDQRRADEDLYVKKSLAGKDLRRDARDEVQEAHTNVLRIMSDINGMQKSVSLGEIDPAMANPTLQSLQHELSAATAKRDRLLTGREPAIAPEQAPTTRTPRTAPTGPKAAAPLANSSRVAPPTSPSAGSGLPFKQRTEIQQKATQDKLKMSTDTIALAHSEAEKFATHRPAIERLFQMVTTKDIGNRLGNLPGGETALRVWSQDNDELQKLRNQIIDTIKKEGQSQLMNTLPELAIASDMFPSVTNSPDINRRSMANVMNLYEARMAAPSFLESWAQQHGGSIDGARQMFREWMKHNPSFQSDEANGRVAVRRNDRTVPVETWTRLRQQFSEKDLVKKRDAGKIQMINGRVFIGD